MKKFLFFLFTIFNVSALHSQTCRLKLSGHVHSTLTHENLPNATIRLVEKDVIVITDDKGDFRFEGLCAGLFTIQVTHASYDTIMRRVNVNANTHTDFDLITQSNTLSEVTVTGIKAPQSTGIKKELSGRELDQSRGLSLAEALSKMNGVTMLQTGSNVSKPVIHGLHSNRILTINNGVRQEGQQWGNEHAPEIDPFIANRLTVIKGVDELRYGSDAIGGVILIEPKPLQSVPGYNMEINTMYFTNNRHGVLSGIWEQQLKRLPSFSYRLQGTLKKAANAATPHYRLNNTGSEENNFSATAGWRREHFNTEVYYSRFSTTIGIFTGSHIGNLSNLISAIAAPRPDAVFTGRRTYAIERPSQEVVHNLLKWKSGFDISTHKFNVLVAGQYNRRKEYDVVRSASNKSPQIDLAIFTFSEELNWEHPVKHNLKGVLGLVAMQQDNSYSGRYLVPAYRLNSYGAYFIEKWQKNKWNVEAGLRFDDKNINSNRLQANGTVFDKYDFHFSTFASSLNAGHEILSFWKANANLSLSGRSPHINELLTNGIHHGNGTYEEGNINLKIERSINISLNNSFSSQDKSFSVDLSLYHNLISNFIYQQPKPDEPVLTIRGAFPKIVYQSTDAALSGMDLTAAWNPLKKLSMVSKYSLLRARNETIGDWLIGMPADRISNEITWNLKGGRRLTNTHLSLEVQHVLEQTRVPGEENGKQDYKMPPAAYTLVNANISTSFKAGSLPLTVSLGGRNLLNKSYRDYLNSFRYFTDEMGRNISLRLKLALNHLY